MHRVRENPGRCRTRSGSHGMTERNGFSVIGKPLPKVDAVSRVTGQAIYADDMLPPRTLHCRILRSPHPHARILSIDTSPAQRIPRVVAAVPGPDLPIKFCILPFTHDARALDHAPELDSADPTPA